MADLRQAILALKSAAKGKVDERLIEEVEKALPASLLAELIVVERRSTDALEAFLAGVEAAPISWETGVCCCGDDIEAHNEGSGHAPVDSGRYHIESMIKEAKAVIAAARIPILEKHLAALSPEAPAREKGPGGYLVKDFADGWYWTPNAALDHAGGAPVWSVSDARYETDPPALTPRHEAPADPRPTLEEFVASLPQDGRPNPPVPSKGAWENELRMFGRASGHEAPAEGAGEPMDAAESIHAAALIYEDKALLDDAEIVLKHLRARSSAPEAREGEPVGVVYSLKADLNTAELPDGTLLYTHPAHPSADHAELTRLAEAAGGEALGNLLAVIHGDGGHRALEVGTEQAAIEAEKIVARLLSSAPEAREGEPVAVTIFCPQCALPHIDEGEWATTRHHKTHQCQGCGHEWRPFPFATVGVTHPAAPSADKLPKASGVMIFHEGEMWSVQVFYENQQDAHAAYAALHKGDGQ